MADTRSRRSIDLVLLVLGLTIIYIVSPFAIDGDGIARFRAMSRLLEDGELDRTPYSLVGPLLSAPLWWLGALVQSPEWWAARYNFLLFVGSLVVFYRILTPAIDREAVVRFLLILTLASMFPYHLGRYYGEVFTALMVGLGVALVCVRHAYWGWVLVVLGVANTPSTAPVMALVALVWSWRTRDLRHLAPILVVGVLIAGEAWLRRGGPFETGYGGNRGAETIMPYSGLPGFSYPLLLGLISILFSFGKGLFLFSPGLLLIRRQMSLRADASRVALSIWALFIAGLVVVYAKWWSWYGGVFWGPRFFLFASIPAALALACWSLDRSRPHWRDSLAWVAMLWSLWVGVNGLVFRQYGLDVCTADHYALEFLCWYVPEYSVLFRPFVEMKPLDTQALVVLAYFAVVGLYLTASRLRLGSTPS